jgi:hypothetical protein
VLTTCTRVKGVVLLVVGSLPLAALTWWSAITPVLATLVLVLRFVASRPRDLWRYALSDPGTDQAGNGDRRELWHQGVHPIRATHQESRPS